VQIAAYLLSTTRAPSDEWLAAHPAPAAGGGDASHGKELVGSLGCRACHALSADEVAGQLGSNKDIAPNLANVAEKTGARWIYQWDPEPARLLRHRAHASLRLSDDEASDVTAYLATLGKPRRADEALSRSSRPPRTSRPAKSSCASTAVPAATTSRGWRRSRASA